MPLNPSSPTVILFSRSPKDESAKSRLRKTLPDYFINQLHYAFVFDSVTVLKEIMQQASVTCSWDVNSEPELDSLIDLLPDADHCVQVGASFADKLTHALRAERDKKLGALIVIGSDCPLLSPDILLEAIEATLSGNLVIGPAPQGGFYLLGLPPKSEVRDFREILSHSLEVLSLREAYKSFPLYTLPYLYDIDLEEDLVSLIAELRLREEMENELTGKSWIPAATRNLLQNIQINTEQDTRDKKLVVE